MQNYRDALAMCPPQTPAIPYLGTFPKDLIAVEEGNPNWVGDKQQGVVNFRKMR